MIKNIELKNIPIKIRDEESEIKHYDILENTELEIKKEGVKRPFVLTKIGDNYVLYNYLNTFIAAKNAGLKEVKCKVISDKMQNFRIKELKLHRKKHKIKEI